MKLVEFPYESILIKKNKDTLPAVESNCDLHISIRVKMLIKHINTSFGCLFSILHPYFIFRKAPCTVTLVLKCATEIKFIIILIINILLIQTLLKGHTPLVQILVLKFSKILNMLDWIYDDAQDIYNISICWMGAV